MVEALFEVATSRNQAQSTTASDLEDNQETPKSKKYRWKDTRSLANDVSEPELPFKSPHTLLNASQSRRTTKKTYAEAVSGGSEDEAEVKMWKKAAQYENQERDKDAVVTKAPMVRSSAR